MSQARTARRRRRQMAMNNAHLSGLRVPRYGAVKDKEAQARKMARKRAKWAATGSSLAGAKS